ncbi:MAG: hypothetical protein HQL40_04870 [Alphaproteobacteria bacterium]|nr:hypothetical protein [Alphaproteobacteria bacterium]
MKLEILPKGATFTGVLRFHNLRPWELGALLWAIQGDGKCAHRHTLGMGKPFGLGHVSVAVDTGGWDSDVEPNAPNRPAPTPSDCIAAFVRRMDKDLGKGGSWATHQSIRRLRAMMEPENARHNNLRYMSLPVGVKNGNEFINAKKAGQILPEYVVGAQDAPVIQPTADQRAVGTGKRSEVQLAAHPPGAGIQAGARPAAPPQAPCWGRVGDPCVWNGDIVRLAEDVRLPVLPNQKVKVIADDEEDEVSISSLERLP